MPAVAQQNRSLRSLLIGDAVATAGFVLISSVFEEAALWLSPKLHVTPGNVNLTILLLSLMLYDPLMQHILGPGGAVFNPANSVAFGAAGTGPGPFSHHLLRSVSQASGAMLGAIAALVLIPEALQRNFYKFGLGLRAGVGIAQGCLTEGLLSFLINLSILWSMNAKNRVLGFWTPYIATILLIWSGEALTGPSMNPAYTFAWHFQMQVQTTREHVLVYWAAPLLGSLLAGWTWRALQRNRQQQTETNAKKIE